MLFSSCYPLKHQSGGVLISIVGLLLGLVTFALWVTSTMLLGEYKVQNKNIAFNTAMNQLQSDMRHITAQLHLSDIRQNNLNSETTVLMTTSQYQAKNNQPVTLFNVTLKHVSVPITIHQQFVRYSALLHLPAKVDIPNGNPDTLNALFNRTVTTLSPHYFVAPGITSNCNEIAHLAVLWINGDCKIKQGKQIGSTQEPVLIIIKNGDLYIEADVHLYGLVVMLNSPGKVRTVTLMPSAFLYGGITSATTISALLHGHFELDLDVLKTLQRRAELRKIQPVPGSWHDFN